MIWYVSGMCLVKLQKKPDPFLPPHNMSDPWCLSSGAALPVDLGGCLGCHPEVGAEITPKNVQILLVNQ